MPGAYQVALTIRHYSNMANLVTTTVNGNVSASTILDTQADTSEWYNISHCICDGSANSDCIGTGHAFLHVRTPWPTDNAAGVGWNPYMMEVIGYHTYSGEYFHDWTAVVNTTGDAGNTFYGSNIRINRSLSSSDPYVYASANTYGGYKRLCFSMRKMTCCCAGLFWVRMRQNGAGGFRTQYPWATFHNPSQTAAVY